MTNPLQALSDAGVAIWLDDLSRKRLVSGGLAELIATRSVVGVTTNPSIFQAAITGSDLYASQVAQLAGAGKDDAADRVVAGRQVVTKVTFREP
ncbi:MAG TPA: transaldolase family protein, partial [Propionibacteriaceae bacterium]|nr:transaldolase family protein [Propionibacteriaceae bacterium]